MLLDIEPHPEGLPSRVFNAHLDAYLIIGELNPDILPYMNYNQLYTINEVKKAINRITYNDESEG